MLRCPIAAFRGKPLPVCLVAPCLIIRAVHYGR